MKNKAFIGASLLAAAAASLCCTLPLIAAIVGFSAAGAAGFFAAWRPYLLGITAVLIVLGFYFSYRNSSRASCEQGSACEHPATSRYGRVGLWLATVFVILFAAFPYYAPAIGKLVPSRHTQYSSPAHIEHVSLAVQGMTCPVCAQGIEHRLNGMTGIRKATVSYERKTAEIDYDPHLVKIEQIEKPFQDAGFNAVSR